MRNYSSVSNSAEYIKFAANQLSIRDRQLNDIIWAYTIKKWKGKLVYCNLTLHIIVSHEFKMFRPFQWEWEQIILKYIQKQRLSESFVELNLMQKHGFIIATRTLNELY